MTYDVECFGPRSVILKLPHPSSDTRAAASAFRFYEREVGFYDHIGDRTPLGSPRCYASWIDAATGDFGLLLEDLVDLDQRDQLAGCSVEDAMSALSALAAHHARWWNDPEILAASWTGPLSAPPIPEVFAHLVERNLPSFEASFDELLDPNVLSAARRLSSACRSLAERLSNGSRTLLHGDYRLDNLFFGTGVDGHTRVVAVDWQMNSVGVGPYDVAYFLSQSLESSIRSRHDRDLLGTYHDALRGASVRDYSFEQCWEDYRVAALWVLVYPVAGTTDAITDERARQLLQAMATRSARTIVDIDALALLPE